MADAFSLLLRLPSERRTACLSDPWKPTVPALVQGDRVALLVSHSDIVLLNDAKICTCADDSVRFVFRLAVDQQLLFCTLSH